MKPNSVNLSFLLHPIVPILLYLFISITNLHSDVLLLLTLHTQSVIFILTLYIFFLYYLSNKDKDFKDLKKSASIGLLFLISPLITSIVNGEQLSILHDSEFRDLFQTFLIAPIIFLFLSNKKYQELILNFIIISYTILGIQFIYRFLILHEVREFDLRPKLNIRHGDANFLCMFFSIIIPLALMQASNYYLQKKKLICAFFVIVGLFLLSCALLTESRMGLIALAGGLLYLLVKSKFNLPTFLKIIFTCWILLMCILSGDKIINRFMNLNDKSNTDRYHTIKNGITVFSNNLTFGAGIHNTKKFFYNNTTYPSFQSEFSQLDVHNTFIQVASELGIIGLLFFSTLFIWPWRRSLEQKTYQKYFLTSSMIILTLSIMTIGVAYKDLFIMHLFTIASLANDNNTQVGI